MKEQISAVIGFMVLTAIGTAHAAVEISSNPTANMTCSGGVCMPTAKKAVLNVADLADMLASGNATIKTNSLAQDIEIDAKLSWTSTNRLTLDAYRAITINRPLEAMGTGALTITTNDGGTGGDYRFLGKGHAKFSDIHSNLTINGHRYQLFKSFKTFRRALRGGAGTGQYFAQANDWDMSGPVHSSSPIDLGFEGAFEGLGNAITHLTIHQSGDDDSTALGFFSAVALPGVVRDATLTDVDVSGVGLNLLGIGALAGGNAGIVSNSRVAGQVSSAVDKVDVGGLLGRSGGVVSNCSANATVSGNASSSSGGLVGHNLSVDESAGTVRDSYSSGSVSGGSAIGGLIGKTEGGNISNSYSTATVAGSDGSSAGGLIGTFAPGDTTTPTLGASYSTGAVSGGSSIGGLIGQDAVGSGITNSYWDMDTSGTGDRGHGAGNIQNDPGITGLSDAQFKSGLPSGFDPLVWKNSAKLNTGYPYLLANPPG
jgi:hypothetical protein